MMERTESSGGLVRSAIPPKLQRRARRLLVAGATFEETLGELRRRGAEQVSIKAVQDFFRSSLDVQRERIERRRQALEELKQALTGPDSVRRSLAEAALLTGLTELTAPSGLDRRQLNNYRLQLHALRLKHQSATLAQRVAQTRLRLARANLEMARLKLADLERELEKELRQHQLNLPAIAEIKKIQALMGNLPILGRPRGSRPDDGLRTVGDNPPNGE